MKIHLHSCFDVKCTKVTTFVPFFWKSTVYQRNVSLTGTGSPDGQARRDVFMFLPSFVTAFSCMSQSKRKPLLRCKQEEQASLLDY